MVNKLIFLSICKDWGLEEFSNYDEAVKYYLDTVIIDKRWEEDYFYDCLIQFGIKDFEDYGLILLLAKLKQAVSKGE